MTTERGYWSNLTALQKVALILGIPASATVLYILYRRYRESRGRCRSFHVPQRAIGRIIGTSPAAVSLRLHA
uniref:Uncharacterized protein n=1 Tax=Apteryx owenii TaxID=8824 RepID=A0A8B9PUJ5_APTOW